MAERSVRFYEIVTEAHEHIAQPLPWDDLMDAVSTLPDAEAYVKLNRLEVLGSIYKPPRGAGARGRVPLLMLDRIDRDVRLRIERRRNYRPLALNEDETLAEPAFFALFDRNVLGVMRNSGNAPGVASLRDYINRLELFSEKIQIVPLADANALRALRDVETLTRFDFAVGADVNAEVFGAAPFIRRTIQAVRGELGGVYMEVTVKISPTGQHETAESARDQIEDVIQSDAAGYFDKASMRYRRLEDGRADAYDFINEAVAHGGEVDLDPETSKPTEVSASEGLYAVYQDLYDDIQSALNSAS